jgi:hypothetical protein
LGYCSFSLKKQKTDDLFHGIIMLKEIYEKPLKKDKENMTYLNRTFPYITQDYNSSLS